LTLVWVSPAHARRDPTEYVELDEQDFTPILIVSGATLAAIAVVLLVKKGEPRRAPAVPAEASRSEYAPLKPLPGWMEEAVRRASPLVNASVADLQWSQREREGAGDGAKRRYSSAVQTSSNGGGRSRAARTVAGLVMAGGGLAITKWGYDRPNHVTTVPCIGYFNTAAPSGVNANLWRQTGSLGGDCDPSPVDVGRPASAIAAMATGIGLTAVGLTLSLVP
jgi:hypothetical protein